MELEYNMSKTLADSILKDRKGADKKMDPQTYLIKYVNEQCNLKGVCVKVYTTL